jgi:hypothetical protein
LWSIRRQKNNPLQDQPRPSKPPERIIKLQGRSDPIQRYHEVILQQAILLEMKLDVTGWFNNAKVLVPIVELAKIPSMKHQIKEVLGLEPTSQATHFVDESEDAPIILQTMHKRSNNMKNQPFFISLIVEDLFLHNCMLDSRASTNVMSLKVMEHLGLKISRPYKNICAMDSREVKVCGLIKDLQVFLATHQDICLVMDIVVIDVPDAWGMLLSRKWATDLGGNIQLDLSYATIPNSQGFPVILHRESMRKYHVEDPRDPKNELVFFEELGSYTMLTTELAPRAEVNMWKMNFDREKSQATEPRDLNERVDAVAISSTMLQEFAENQIDWREEGSEEEIKENKIPTGLIPLECLFDKHDRYKEKKEMIKPNEYEEVNIGSTEDPKMMEIDEGISRKERKAIENLIRKFRDTFAFPHDGLKAYKGDVIQHTIPLKEGAKPLRYRS